MNIKTFSIIFFIAAALFGIALTAQNISIAKGDAIIEQNNKEIITKEYKTKITLNKNLKEFNCKIDSSLVHYKQNQILCDGYIIKAQHNSQHEVIMKTIKKENKNGKIYYITTNEDVAEYFSCRQIDELKTKIGKRMIITKVFFPKERIFYKFP